LTASDVFPDNPFKDTIFGDQTVIQILVSCDVINNLLTNEILDITWAYDQNIFSIVPGFDTDPEACPIDYTCATNSGPALSTDLCNAFTFDSDTGTYSVDIDDPTLYPPGVYEIEICGTAGTQSGCETFTITVVDPCTVANLSLAREILKPEENHKVGDAPAIQTWSSLDLLVSDRVYDCGAPTFILTKPDESPFDTTLF